MTCLKRRETLINECSHDCSFIQVKELKKGLDEATVDFLKKK